MSASASVSVPVPISGSPLDLTGYISFSNVIFVLSILMIILGAVWLFGLHILAIIAIIPLQTIEIILYIGLSICTYNAPQWFGNLAYIWCLLFGLGFSATTVLSATLHADKTGSAAGLWLINMLIHAFIGIYVGSPMICGIAVLCFMYLIGFNFGFGGGFWVVGYGNDDEGTIYSATFASGIVTTIGATIRINGFGVATSPMMKNAQLFVPGALWIGPFVFFISLLIISSKWMHERQIMQRYVNNNVVAIICYIVAVYIGNLYNINQLSGYGGTIFVLYLTQKYIEIMPNKSEVWAATIFVLGVIIYVANVYFRMEVERLGLYEYFHLPFIGY
jgi:hypothetical protein